MEEYWRTYLCRVYFPSLPLPFSPLPSLLSSPLLSELGCLLLSPSPFPLSLSQPVFLSNTWTISITLLSLPSPSLPPMYPQPRVCVCVCVCVCVKVRYRCGINVASLVSLLRDINRKLWAWGRECVCGWVEKTGVVHDVSLVVVNGDGLHWWVLLEGAFRCYMGVCMLGRWGSTCVYVYICVCLRVCQSLTTPPCSRVCSVVQ